MLEIWHERSRGGGCRTPATSLLPNLYGQEEMIFLFLSSILYKTCLKLNSVKIAHYSKCVCSCNEGFEHFSLHYSSTSKVQLF